MSTMSCLNELPSPLVPLTSIGERKWYAIYTASNHERKIAGALQTKGIETFLPLYAMTKRWKNRTTVKIDVPLFPCYVFAKVARNESARVLEVPMVYSIVSNGREPLPVPESELNPMRIAIQHREFDPCPYVKVGMTARIRSGPLAGLQGVIIRKDAKLRVVLNIELIMKSVAVQVDANEIEMISENGARPAANAAMD